MDWERNLFFQKSALIAEVLNISPAEITDVEDWSKGMTNRLMSFKARGKRYLFRMPGEGANALISRRQEADCYAAIAGQNISERVLYLDPDEGYKLAEFLEDAHTCDPQNKEEVARCIAHLKRFHDLKLTVPHTFDPFEKMEYYEKLCEGDFSFKDHAEVKEQILSLKPMLEALCQQKSFCHIDPNCDNFLLCGEDIHLIDWEYAGMCDPHIDIAMFAIYSSYTDEQIDWLIDLYFNNSCPPLTRLKIYGYVAVSGFLWADWSDYKRKMGVSYEEYARVQYSYGKNYYRRTMALRKKIEEEETK